MTLITLGQAIDLIRSDHYRVYGTRDLRLRRLLRALYVDAGLRFLFWHRLAGCDCLPVRSVARLLYRRVMSRHHIIIGRDVAIGFGCRIVHDGPCVVNSRATLGDNVDLLSFVNIGSTGSRAAAIGDEVYVGPSVCIVGDVRIGNGATIGAGAVVVADVEAGTTVAGVPAHVVSRKEPGRLINNKWRREWNRHPDVRRRATTPATQPTTKTTSHYGNSDIGSGARL